MIITAESEANKTQMIFVASLERYLNAEITKCCQECDNTLNRHTLEELKKTVKNCFITIFSKSEIRLTSLSIEWVSLEYFKHICINSKKLGEMLVFSQPDCKQLPVSDIDILKRLFKDTEVGLTLEMLTN